MIIWNLLTGPAARYHDLGVGYHTSRTGKGKKVRNHIRQLQAPGYTVARTQAAWPIPGRQSPARVRCRLHGRDRWGFSG